MAWGEASMEDKRVRRIESRLRSPAPSQETILPMQRNIEERACSRPDVMTNL